MFRLCVVVYMPAFTGIARRTLAQPPPLRVALLSLRVRGVCSQ